MWSRSLINVLKIFINDACGLNTNYINSLRLSNAYMRRWSNHHRFRQWLVAWSAPSHYLNQCWNIVNWTLGNKLQWNFNRNSNISFLENALESVVCEIAAILSRSQCVKEASMPLACIIHRNNELFAMWFQLKNRPRIMHTNSALLSFAVVWYRQVNFVLPCHMGTFHWHWTLALDTDSLILTCVEYWCNYIRGRHSIHCHRWYRLNHVDV